MKTSITVIYQSKRTYRRCPCKPSYSCKTKFYRRDKKRSSARRVQFYA